MTSLRIGHTTWLLSPRHETGLRRTRAPVLAMVGRTLGLAAATVALGFTTIASAPRADQPDAAHPIAYRAPVPSARSTMPDALAMTPFQAAPMGASARFADRPPHRPADGFVAPARPASDWREDEFASVAVLDGRTLVA